VIIVRLKYCPTTRAYLERRTAEGLTKREIIRCLKRYLAYGALPKTPQPNKAVPPQQRP